MRAAGLSYQTVYALLRKPWQVRQVDLATLERLCADFDCKPGDLRGVDKRYPPHSRVTDRSLGM